MVDKLQRAISKDLSLRVVAAVTSELVQDGCARHDVRHGEAIVLGRALTAGCLLSTLAKGNDERVRLDISAGGKVGTILVDSRATGLVRGCLQHTDTGQDIPVYHGRAEVATLVGTGGRLVVTRDLGLDQQYQGTVAVTTGEIDIDIEHYLSQSEQLPSALGCEVVLDAQGYPLRSCGVLCQTFPGGEASHVEAVRALLRAGGLADLLVHDRETEELIGFAMLGGEFEDMGGYPLAFECACTRETAFSVVTTLGADDVDALADEPGETEVRCSFCGARYFMTATELHELASQMRRERS